jgi:hypothetical protein
MKIEDLKNLDFPDDIIEIRKYYIFANGKEFPTIASYEKRRY